LLLQVVWLQALSRRQGLGFHQGRTQRDRHYTMVDWDKLVRLRKEAEGMVLDFVEGMGNLVVGMGVVVGIEVVADMELESVMASGLRSSAEADIGFGNHPVVAHNLGRADIAAEEGIVLEVGTVVDHTVVVGGVEAGLRNSRCST
jgi:hypothetical protein